MEVVEVPISRIKVTTRLRATSEEKIQDLAESIGGVGLLHPITVSQKGENFHLLAGNHRLESAKSLGWKTIPVTIKSADPLIEELIEIEENLISHRLNSIQEATHLVRWEEILSSLGKRAVKGDNRWKRSGLTTKDLAASRGMSVNTYQYTKKIADLHPEVQDILNETEFANNKMDMVALSKENDDVQLEVANLLATGKTSTFKRALTLARIKHYPFNWEEEQTRVKELVGKPFSVMKWNGDSSSLAQLCKLVKEDESCKVIKQQWGTESAPLAAMHPDHSAFFINYYSKEGDTIGDPFVGRGGVALVAAALGRKVIGYDLSPQNLETVRSACLEHTSIQQSDLNLHCNDGCLMEDYADQENLLDLVVSDPPFAFGVEQYGDDPRDLCQMKDLEGYISRMEECLTNLKRLIKPSCWEKKEFHPIVMKVGSARRGEKGLICLGTELEIIGRRLGMVLHDKVTNVLDSQWGMFNVSRCIDHRYTVKIHETNLVFVKY